MYFNLAMLKIKVSIARFIHNKFITFYTIIFYQRLRHFAFYNDSRTSYVISLPFTIIFCIN